MGSAAVVRDERRGLVGIDGEALSDRLKCLFGRRDLQGSRDQPGLYASRLEVAFGEFQRTPRFRCHEELV